MNSTLQPMTSIPLDPAPPADTSAATTYTDVNGLAALAKDPNSTQSIDAVASQVEALFLQMMLRSMRDASMGDALDSNEMNMYQDMFDKQVALTISQHQDLGIGAMLRRQLSDKGKASPAKIGSRGAATPAATAAASGAVQGLAQTPAEFVQTVLPGIRRAAVSLGVNPLGLLAQAALETGWGQRMPQTAEGAPSHNIFGVKAGEEWSGARATADTVEFAHGIATPRRTAFRAYSSIEDSIADFAKLLKQSPRYRDALAAGGDVQAYVASIGKSGYATDPGYADKLNRILNSATLQSAFTARMAAL